MSQGPSEQEAPYKRLLIEKRARCFEAIRKFFKKKGYLEVDTPILVPYPLPEAHIDPVKAEGGYLHPSPELAMKVLLSYGPVKIYQITRCFRKGEMGRLHLQEFSMLEWYEEGVDYNYMMDFTEELIKFIAWNLNKSYVLCYNSIAIDLQKAWPKLALCDLFMRETKIDLDTALKRNLYEELFVEKVEPKLPKDTPCFLIDFPAQLASLSKLKDENTAERFELYIGGLEIANGFSELLDPEEQEKRFISENTLRSRMGKETFPVNKVFLSAISKVRKAAGVALGIDRLLMILLDVDDISYVQPITYKDLIP